ncbi:MAG: hypothetical protein MUC77_02730 [Chromatiaceae bacterium]|nr:hypothetical protein [Chromatiaceae bacterium]
MNPPPDSVGDRLRAPRAAAVAGILFSVLFMTSIGLLRVVVPEDPTEAGAWLEAHAGQVATALYLVPFSGIAFLWFMAVLRDRLSQRDDVFFSTLFLGSGLLFVATLFLAAGVAGGIIIAYGVESDRLPGSASFILARAISYEVMHVYSVRMAAMFMLLNSALALRTGFIARWIAFLGLGLALLLLVSNRSLEGVVLVFPLWVLLISLRILYDDFGRGVAQVPRRPGA